MQEDPQVRKLIMSNAIPTFPAMILFGLIFGFTGNLADLPLILISAMSYIIFAGSAQFIILLLLMEDQQWLAIVITAFLVNARHAIYGIAMKKKLRGGKIKRLLLAYFLIDESFLVFNLTERQLLDRAIDTDLDWVFLRGAIPMWLIWNTMTVIGYLLFNQLGNVVDLPGNFIIASTFIGFLVDQWRKKENRWIILLSSALCIVFGFILDNSVIFVLIMTIGIVATMVRKRKEVIR